MGKLQKYLFIFIILIVVIGITSMFLNANQQEPELTIPEWGTVPYNDTYYAYAVLILDERHKQLRTLDEIKVGSTFLLDQYAIKGIPQRFPNLWEQQEKLQFPLELEPNPNIILFCLRRTMIFSNK
ncbi:hypothetical protein [Alkalihalobacterium chitinilyticum]|uniref:DUF3221 domain-containing protein n=1 Tax=Alkalihalobacterium chitinilyticum TaxID=2980103 RepID=A0ABT5VCS6_9BACI|nr:hypothetical protein [Alkalihalobacterium chitinilyticum]MDE5413254.1 hypothetical protein [Alkalihalobacterium chitinilyticum]